MKTDQFVSHLCSLDIKLWLEDERLCCDAPAGVLTAELKSELAARKAEISAFLRDLGSRDCYEQPIRKVPRENDFFPASFNQKRLWFVDQLLPNSAYSCYRTVHIEGPLNLIALEKSLNEIVRRHESLRTTFLDMDGQPFQVITAAVNFKVSLIDLRDIDDVFAREATAQRIMTEEVERPFNLSIGPLFRAHLLCIGRDEHILLLTMHHAVTDRWSNGILLGELEVLYEGYCTNKSSQLPDPPLQYVDFAYWQSERLRGEVLEEELSFWRTQLRGAPQVLQFPTDRPRPRVQSFEGSTEVFKIPKLLTKALKTLSNKEGATLYMTLLAAFQTLLFRYSGQEDIVIGSPIAGRIRPEIEKTIGLFINTLVLRTDLSGNPSFRQLLKKVREVAISAYAHQEVPFEKLIEDLHLERSLSFMPVFQVMFALQNTPESELKLWGANVTPVTINRQTSMFDIFLALYQTEQGLEGRFSYKTDLFDVLTITRMIEHFRVLLEAVVADPDQKISDLPLLTERETLQLLVEWNDTSKPYSHTCIHELFELQVERTPGAIAVASQDEQLTYRELNARANQLAHHLQSLGVRPETLVCICVERSLELIVGVLGILKAGGAYVPLDPAYPKDRLAFMLEDSRPLVVLTQQKLLSQLPVEERPMTEDRRPMTDDKIESSFPSRSPVSCLRSSVVCLDADWEVIARECEDNPNSGTTADNLAYIIYTSGSTGEPKGVMIQHSSLVNYIEAANIEFGMGPGDRLLQFASVSFDTSVEEIFFCLTSGATLLLRTDTMLDPAVLLQTCQDWNVTVIDLPTAYLHELAAELATDNRDLPGFLRLVHVGGEKLQSETVANWRHWVNEHVRLDNGYGPTEATITATSCTLCRKEETDGSSGVVPIGRPVPNAQVYVLDKHLNPVPIGVPGEMYIGGVGIARGYLNRPELTAEKFICNPFGDKPGARLYKTGDIARYLPDGNLDFVGRSDNQVKIRGFRIELGEIETVLSKHSAVVQATVVAREDRPGEKQLVAYLECKPGQFPAAAEVRSFLKTQVPDYMVPSVFVILDALPLTSNGKVDHGALPPPTQVESTCEAAFVAPRTHDEELLTGIWCQLFHRDLVGIHDNFFDLGGHSLLATQLISRVRKAFNKEVSLRTVFENPTVAGLAGRLAEIQAQNTASAEIANVLAELETLSDEDVGRLVDQQGAKSG